jgi:serine beta-lactamase-like protein LACTB, mitochondrial
MMKTYNFYRLFIYATICGVLFSCTQKPADKSVVRDMKYKQSLVDVYKEMNLFCKIDFTSGVAVAVSINNQLVFADGFGYSNIELKVKSSPSNLYRIGQVSELITTLTAAKLYEEGKLDIDKPVSELFPELYSNPVDYTLYQLASHCAGIKEKMSGSENKEINSNEKLIQAFIGDDLLYKPGTTVLQSELGIDLLGYLIQKKLNEPINKVVKETLVDKLNLSGTIVDNPFSIIDKKCSFYDYDFMARPKVANNQIDLRAKVSSSGYLSSVLDLVKIGNAFLYPGFLKKETLDRITKSYELKGGNKSPFSFGLIVNKDFFRNTFWGIKGVVSGGTAALLIYPEDKMVVAIASNVGNTTFELPVFKVASIFQDQLHPERVALIKEHEKKIQDERQKRREEQTEIKKEKEKSEKSK